MFQKVESYAVHPPLRGRAAQPCFATGNRQICRVKDAPSKTNLMEACRQWS